MKIGLLTLASNEQYLFSRIWNNYLPKKKLTITIEESVKERAKRFAKKHQTSISEIVETFLASVTDEEMGFTPEPGSWTESLYGSASLPPEYEGMSYQEIKEKEVLKKHGWHCTSWR